MPLTKPCLVCKKTIIKQPSRSLKDWHSRTKYCSKKCLYKITRARMRGNKYSLGVIPSKETLRKKSEAQKGEKGSNWQGDKVGYTGIHNWLKTNFGKANRCENKKCMYPRMGAKKMLLKPYRYEWSLVSGKKLGRKRENFKKLCISCHRKIDGNKKTII